MTINRHDGNFRDEYGRTLILRGVNLAGSSKVPYTPDGATHIREGFFNHREVSFVGRPFPLAEADEHFRRLHSWGFTFLRLLVTWEAIEHAGPGIYDEEYLDYIAEIVRLAGEYGFHIFIDPHQDVWSRFSGGDGAPGWTLEKVGFEMQNFGKTGAAIVHQLHGDPFPRMIWSSNYNKLATATMFTLFFAGDIFAPETKIDGVSAQEYLQRHYINAVKQVVQRVHDMPHVIGYDIFNEPSKGWIGRKDINTTEGRLKQGNSPTPYQSMLLGCGYPQVVDVWASDLPGTRRVGKHLIDPKGARAWQEGRDCIWRENGVWDFDSSGTPRLRHSDYFANVDNRPCDFPHDCLRPFANRFARAVHEIDPDAMIFLEFDAFGEDKLPYWQPTDAPNIVYAPHWYDALTLLTKRYFSFAGVDVHRLRPVFGRENVRRSYNDQLRHHKELSKTHFSNVPTLIGEIGIPYDLNGRHAYMSGDYSAQNDAIDDYMQALDANLLNATIWNYTPDNSNMRGDLWNGEDLSIYSRDQRNNPHDINSGGRGLKALLRPYARAVAGKPLRMRYDMESAHFEFSFQHDPKISQPTEIFVPNYQYPDGYLVEVNNGSYEKDPENQRLYYYPSGKEVPHLIRIRPRIPRPQKQPTPFGWIALLLAALLAFIWWWRRKT